MPKAKPLSKQQILAAMAKTKSNRAAARYLNVSYVHYKKWAKLYQDEETRETLFDKHLNPSGKGIPKFLSDKGKEPAVLDIIEGRVDPSHFTPEKIKEKLIKEGYLKEECAVCGFHETRVLDYKSPLLMYFQDGNKKNYKDGNVQLLCYNHYFLNVGDVFNEQDLTQIESHNTVNNTTKAVEWEVDNYHLQRLKELGLEVDEDDANELISRL